MSARRTCNRIGLTLTGVIGGGSSLWLAPAAWAEAELAALGLQTQTGGVQLVITWQGDAPPSSQIQHLSDHRLVVRFDQVGLLDPAQYTFPSEWASLGIQSLHWSQQGTTGQIEITTEFPLSASLGAPLPAQPGSSSTQSITLGLNPRPIPSQKMSLSPPDPAATAIVEEQARLEALLQDLRHAKHNTVSTPPIDPPQPPLQQASEPPEAPIAVLPPPSRSTSDQPSAELPQPESPAQADHLQAAKPLEPAPISISNSKLADLSTPFSTARRGPLIAQSPATASDGATGFASYVDSRTSAFVNELSKLEDQLQHIRWNVLRDQQQTSDAEPEEEIVILTPSLSTDQPAPPPDLVILYGNQPAPQQDLVDLYGPPAQDLPQTEPLPPFTLSDLDPLPWFAQIPDLEEVEPELVPAEPTEPQITITIPTSHAVGAIGTVRSIATVSSSNDFFTQLRSLDGAIGGVIFSRTDTEAGTNIGQISPEAPEPLFISYGDEGVGIDAAAVERSIFTTTTQFGSALFDYTLAGFGAVQGSLFTGCVNAAEGPWTVVTPDSIFLDPETQEQVFIPAGGDLLDPGSSTLGGVDLEDICRQVSNEVVAEVLREPDNLINNPNALVIDVDNVEVVNETDLLSRSSTTDTIFTVIPQFWDYAQKEVVGDFRSGSASILRQWFIDPRADLGANLAGVIAATFFPELDPIDDVENTPVQGILELNPITFQAKRLLVGSSGRPNDEFRPAWASFQALGANAVIAETQIPQFPVRGFGFEFGAIETASTDRIDFTTRFDPVSEQEVFTDISVAGGGAGININDPENSVDIFIDGSQPNTAVAVQIEVLETPGITTEEIVEEIETDPGLAFNFGYTRLGEGSQILLRPTVQYSPEQGEVGLGVGGFYQTQLGRASYSLTGRYHTNQLFSYDGIVSSLVLPVFAQPNTGLSLFTAQSVDTRLNASSVVFGSSFRLGRTLLSGTVRPPLVNEIDLIALNWRQSWSDRFSSTLGLSESNQGTGLSAELRQALGVNQEIVLRASSFDGDTQGIQQDLQGTEINRAEFSIEARF